MVIQSNAFVIYTKYTLLYITKEILPVIRMNRAGLYKQRNFGNELTRLVRVRELQNRRCHQREVQLSKARDNDVFNNEVQSRKLKLQKWKLERNIKKELAAKNKKPAFVVGVVRHHLFSPTKNDSSFVHCHSGKKNYDNHVPKRITPATRKRLAAKQYAAANVTPGEGTSGNKQWKSSTKKNNGIKSFAPVNHQFRAPSGLKLSTKWGATYKISRDPEIGERTFLINDKFYRSPKVSIVTNDDTDESTNTFDIVKKCLFSDNEFILNATTKIPIIINVIPATPREKTPSKITQRKLSVPMNISPLVMNSRVLRTRTTSIGDVTTKNAVSNTPTRTSVGITPKKIDGDRNVNLRRGNYRVTPSTPTTDDSVFDSPIADCRKK